MQREHVFLFRSFRLDPVNERLWRGSQVLTLRPKTFAVLRYLLERPGQLVTKKELLDVIWSDAAVSDVVTVVCIQELRQVLDDQPTNPRFVETVSRRGYRFIAPVATTPLQAKADLNAPSVKLPARARLLRPTSRVSRPTLVGRNIEIKRLQDWLADALHGERKIAFVTGETGIGKTTLVEEFLDHHLGKTPVWRARGQCIEHSGEREAYLPILDALSRLCREPKHEHFVEILGQYAPTWLVQLPWLMNAADSEAAQRKIIGVTKERMLWEIAEALEALTTKTPLVLFLEDLQWSDAPTLDLLSFLARRHEPAKLLIIGSYRPEDLAIRSVSLSAVEEELLVHGQCEELLLQPLPETAVTAYLAERLEGVKSHLPLQELGRIVHQRTDGNPLFMVHVVDYLVAEGLLVKRETGWELQGNVEEITSCIPENLRRIIGRQFERLGVDEQAVLEVASVVGREFSTSAVIAGLEKEQIQVEQCCETLVRKKQFLRPTDVESLPDRTVTARYTFLHALHQNVLYERLTPARGAHLHARIGEWMETTYKNQEKERASELAVHFEKGRDYYKAVRYLRLAAVTADRRHASREALGLVAKGLELLKSLPDTPERAQEELLLQLLLGRALQYKRTATPEAAQAYARAKALCKQGDNSTTLFWALCGLFDFHLARGELRTTHEVGEELLLLAQQEQYSERTVWAHTALGISLLHSSKFDSARLHFEEALFHYHPQAHSPLIGVACLANLGLLLWTLGYVDEAFEYLSEASRLAPNHSNQFASLYLFVCAAILYWFTKDRQKVQENAERALAIAPEDEFKDWTAIATILQGGAFTERSLAEESLLQIRQGLATLKEREIYVSLPLYLLVFAETLGRVGQTEEGLLAVEEAVALAEKLHLRFPTLPELYRVKGELLLQKARQVTK